LNTIAVRLYELQPATAQAGDRDRIGVGVVGLAATATTEGTDARRQLRGNVQHGLALRGEPLGQSEAAAVCTLDSPGPGLPGPGERFECAVTLAVVAEPLGCQDVLTRVEDQHGVAALVRVDTDDHCRHLLSIRPSGRRGGQCYFGRSRPLLSHSSPGSARRVSTPLASHTRTWAAGYRANPPST
jgi:hypothetical protein